MRFFSVGLVKNGILEFLESKKKLTRSIVESRELFYFCVFLCGRTGEWTSGHLAVASAGASTKNSLTCSLFSSEIPIVHSMWVRQIDSVENLSLLDTHNSGVPLRRAPLHITNFG